MKKEKTVLVTDIEFENRTVDLIVPENKQIKANVEYHIFFENLNLVEEAGNYGVF